MSLKTTLIVCVLVVMIAYKTESRGGMFARLCNLFADEPTGEVDTPTVKDYCEEIKSKEKEIITNIMKAIADDREKLKAALKGVCTNGDFGADTRQGKVCARLLASDDS